jgi:hypothetical protein
MDHLNLHRITKLSVLILLIAISGSAQPDDEKTMTIDCACQTKPNPSECKIRTVPFQEITWSQTAFRKEGDPLDAAALALYCQRHANDGCQCLDDTKYFKGSIRN